MNHGVTDDSSPTREHVPINDAHARSGDGVAHVAAASVNIERDPTVISHRPAAAPADFVRSLSLVELSRTLEGRQLHHFAVDRMIGGGGMGAVFRGRDLRLDRDVAIKVIPESRRDPETLRRFRMEAQSAARLDHPNIARVYDIGEDEAWNYIVFEYIEGINLRDLVLNEGPMSIDDAVFTTRQVAEALQHAHDRDVVHRDIKPSNVIITPTGIAKVVDMGLARNTAMDRSTADQTASGVTLGTFDYISPEQARDPRDADVRSDLYSLGCTLFYMLTGQPPFPEGTALQKLLNHGSQPPPDPRQWRDDISDQLWAVLAKLMAKRPADRYQKPHELINDLLLIAQIESLPRSRSPGTIQLRPTIARRSLLETHLPWLIPLAALLLSAFWLQSADSLSTAFEIPKPDFLTIQSSGPIDHNSRSSNSPAVDDSSSIRTNIPGAQNASAVESNADMLRSPNSSESRSIKPQTSSEVGSPMPRLIGEAPSTNGINPASTGNSSSAIKAGTSGADSVSPFKTTLPAIPSTEANPSIPTAPLPNVAPSLDKFGSSAPEDGATIDTVKSPLSAIANALVEQTSTNVQPTNVQPSVTEANSGLPGSSNAPSQGNVLAANSFSSEPVSNTENATHALPTDTIVVSTKAVEPSRGRWVDSLASALQLASSDLNIRTIELRDSIELDTFVTIPRSGLTIRAAGNTPVEIVLTGEQTYGMGWETWFDLQRYSLRCENLHILCRNDMRQTQALFALRLGGKLELNGCTLTMAHHPDAPMGNCVVISDHDRTKDASITSNFLTAGSSLSKNGALTTSSSSGAVSGSSSSGSATPGAPGTDSEPVAISMRDCVVRGQQNLFALRVLGRAEFNVDQSCLMLEGRTLTVRGNELEAMPPVLRFIMSDSTVACQQGFASVHLLPSEHAPLTLMRTAKSCAFWSPVSVPHIAVDGLSDESELSDLLQLRGEDNAYDQNIELLCQCRLADGKHIDFSFRDATGEWFRERGNDNLLRWSNSIPPDRSMENQEPEDYRLRDGMFMPGFPSAKLSNSRP